MCPSSVDINMLMIYSLVIRFYDAATNGGDDCPPAAKRAPSLFLHPSPFLYPLPSNASLFDYTHPCHYPAQGDPGFERRDGGITVRDVSTMNASFPESRPGPSRNDDEWKNINTMLNCILSMVEKTKRALAILQQRGVEPTESSDIKRAASEIMAAAVRQTEERVAEVRRRAEDAVNQCCWNCGRKAQETCSGCNAARYCGAFCQHKDWENHHQVCSGREQKPTAMLRTSPPAANSHPKTLARSTTPITAPANPPPTSTERVDNRLSLTSLNSAERLLNNQDRSLTSNSERIALATLSTAQGLIGGIGGKK
ncbi:hypothetical protein evm_001832 [Chilo suppressalis]|nr:hypothetical protein evm_001832 [Chilo suppressalis]